MKILQMLFFGTLSLFLVSCSQSVPTPQTENTASVRINVASTDGKSALTFWRSIDAQGNKGKRFSIGGASSFGLLSNSNFKKAQYETLELDAGIYYLDSFQIQEGKRFIVSEQKHYTARNGWDDKANKPFFLAFSVKEGENLELPPIVIKADVKNNKINIYIQDGANKGRLVIGTKISE